MLYTYTISQNDTQIEELDKLLRMTSFCCCPEFVISTCHYFVVEKHWENSLQLLGLIEMLCYCFIEDSV